MLNTAAVAPAAAGPAATTSDASPRLGVVPERRAALVLLAAAALWLLPGSLGVAAGFGGIAVTLLLMLVDALRLPSRVDLDVERAVPTVLGLGDDVELRYALTSRWGSALSATLEDDLPSAIGGGLGAATIELPARARVERTAHITGLQRGRHALGEIGVRVRTPLGLMARRIRVRPDDSVLVAPSIRGVRHFRLLAVQHRLHEAGVRALRQRGDGRALAGLREYVLGDDPRFIDWKATARRTKLITREFAVEQSQTVFVLLDAGRSMTQLAGRFTRFEHALAATMVLSDAAATAGDRVGALAFDEEIRAFVPPQRGGPALRGIRSALIPVQPTLVEPDYAAAFRYLAARQRRRALIVFFTDVIDVRASRSLIAHVARGALRHLVVIVAMRNDALVAAADAPGTSERALYERAAAEEVLVARADAIERMRRAGATVLDVPPAGMTGAVVNRYIEIKSRGAL